MNYKPENHNLLLIIMTRNVLSLMLLLQCRYVLSQDTSSKLETLPSTARIIPGDYVVMVENTEDIDRFIATLNDYHVLPADVLYVYNLTMDHTKPFLQGLSISNVSDVGLQALLESEFVDTIIPVSLDATHLSIPNLQSF